MKKPDGQQGVWKSGKGRGRRTPKGRQTELQAQARVAQLLGDRPRRRDLLIEYLHLIQDAHGHLSAAHLCALAEELRLSQVEVYEVASFYAHFDVVREDETPPPELTVRVCSSLSCRMAGGRALAMALRDDLDPGRVRVVDVPCIGACDRAPAAVVGQRLVPGATPEAVCKAALGGETAAVLPNYERLDAYQSGGGYTRLRALRAGGDWQQVQSCLSEAGLRGLGGAGFPSGRKWGFVRAAPGPRFLAVNADEGEPGTFKDRACLETRPHLVLEGMLIAAWAIGADRCYIYLRDEYPALHQVLRHEIKALEAAALVPEGHVELRRGAGAYICGEESAMINSIEGKRGLPRHRPPYVAQVGLFDRPTLVHNVETLYWVARICREGPQLMTTVEHNGRTGLRHYSVSGRVAAPGVYLLPAGSTILDVIKAAGGMAPGHRFTAYQPGGPSSGILPARLDHVPLDFDTLQPFGSFIGSAAVVVLSDHDRARDAALGILEFFAEESCGQCTPCRLGCEKATRLLRAGNWDKPLLADLCQTMEDASICGLGQAAPNAIRLVMAHFPDEV